MTDVLDTDMLDMLRSSLRHVLTEQTGAPLGERLAELGWEDVVATDAPTALRTLFEIKGELCASADALGPALTDRLAAVCGDDLADAAILLPSPYPERHVADGVFVDGIATSLGETTKSRCAVKSGGMLAVCDAHGLTVEPLGGDGATDLGLVRVTGHVANDAIEWLGGGAWDVLEQHGRWLVACELIGVGRHVVASAVDYTKERVQYGKPIGVFQALQHRLASAHSMIVGAGHLVTEAGRTGDDWTAMVAKCMAGQAAEYACTQAQQCFGAIGYTWEHEFPGYLRRMYTLDRMFDDWRTLEHEIGMRLQATGVVPRIGTL